MTEPGLQIYFLCIKFKKMERIILKLRKEAIILFFFYIILAIIFILIILTIFTTIKIHIENIRYSTDKIQGRHLNKNYKIIIKLYLFEKINYLKLDITKKEMEKDILQINMNKFKQKMIRDKNQFDIKTLKSLKYLKVEINEINLEAYIGLEDAAASAILVGGLSSILAIILRRCMEKKNQNYWKITPIYQNRNLLNISLDCIFSLKLIHIIYTIYVLKKKGVENGRTSNRRAYAHSNE